MKKEPLPRLLRSCRKIPSGFSAISLQSAARIIGLPKCKPIPHLQTEQCFRPRTRRGRKRFETLFAAYAANSARLFENLKGASFEAPSLLYFVLIPHRQSGHSRLRFSYRQQQRYRRYLHHGRRRSYVPTGSSA